MNEPQTHTLVATVADHPGVLSRVASLFRRRGFNIASLAVGHSEEPGYSRMTIAVEGSAAEVKQCEKQLYKLVQVVSVLTCLILPSPMLHPMAAPVSAVAFITVLTRKPWPRFEELLSVELFLVTSQ